MKHFVYETTNLINGRKYVGKHSTDLPIDEDNYLGSGRVLMKAINKYGKNNFKREILGVYDTEEEAYEAEKIIIASKSADINAKYYNVSPGGKGNSAGSHLLPFDKSKNPIIYNTCKYISDILLNFEDAQGSVFFKLKYYCGYLILNDFSENAIKDEVYNISKSYMKKYNYSDFEWKEMITDIYSDLVSIEHDILKNIYTSKTICFYCYELDFICRLERKPLRRLAFGILLYYKYKTLNSSNYEWIDLNYPEIQRLSNVVVRNDKRNEFYSELQKLGYILILDNKFKIPYIHNNAKDIFIELSTSAINNNTFLMIYLYNKQQNIVRCKKCGAMIRNNKTGTKLYCDNCSQYKSHDLYSKKCIDCGKEIIVSSRRSRNIRCLDCKKKYNKEMQKNRQRNYRNKMSHQLL